MTQIKRWLVGGIPASILFYGSFFLLTRTGGVSYTLATMTALVLSAILNFVIQKFWAFEDKEIQTLPRQSIQFLGLAIGYFLANVGLLAVFIEYLHFLDWVALLTTRTILAAGSFIVTRNIFAN